MYTVVTKPDKKKKSSRAGSISLPKNQNRRESALGFVDNRPVAIAQRKLQRMVNNSLQVTQPGAASAFLPLPPSPGILQRNPDNENIKKLDEMLDRSNVPEEEVITLLGELTDDERTIVLQGNYRDLIASALDTGEMVRAVIKLKMPLYQQLEWVKAATSPTSIDYSEIQGLIVAAQDKSDQLNALRTIPWRSFSSMYAPTRQSARPWMT